MCKLCLFNKTRQINTIFYQQEKIQMLLFWLSRPTVAYLEYFDQCQKIPTNKPSGLSAWYAPLTVENPVTRQFSICFAN